MNEDFLFEIRTEEIPAPALLPARLELSRRLGEAMAEEGIPPSAVESYATPRRLAVILRGLPERQADRFEEVLGPPAASAFDEEGRPKKAAEGFRAGAEGRRRGPRRRRLAARPHGRRP